MGRGKKKSARPSPHFLTWDPLDELRACLVQELQTTGSLQGCPLEPQPTSASSEWDEWLRQRLEDGAEERRRRQRAPRPEFGWCEFCPQPRHKEAECSYIGPDFCCCCVFPEQEDEYSRCEEHFQLACREADGAHTSLGGDCCPTYGEEEDQLGDPYGVHGVEPSTPACDAGFPPAHPSVAHEAGHGGDRALLHPPPGALLSSPPGPLPDSDPPLLLVASADGSKSWWGESGKDWSGVEPDEEPEDAWARNGDEDGAAPAGGEEGCQAPQASVPAPRQTRQHSPEPEPMEVGHEAARDPASARPELICAAAPGSTRDGDGQSTPAAVPVPTEDGGTVSVGGPEDGARASPAAASLPVPECGPGPDGAAAPQAALDGGPNFFSQGDTAGPFPTAESPAGDTPPAPVPAAEFPAADPPPASLPAQGFPAGDVPPAPPPAAESPEEGHAPTVVATPPAALEQPPELPERSRDTAMASRKSGARAARVRRRRSASPSPALENGAREQELSPPVSALRLATPVPVTRRPFPFDPGGWKPRGGECGARRRGS